jgi:hypothetical protein
MSEQYPKYPRIVVSLINQDGNAFSILGKTIREMRRNHVSEHEINAFVKEASSGDYDHLLAVVQKYVQVI